MEEENHMNDNRSSGEPEGQRSRLVAKFLFIVVLTLLFFLLAHSMMRHHFFSGGRYKNQPSVNTP
jgi:hypothetical protein